MNAKRTLLAGLFVPLTIVLAGCMTGSGTRSERVTSVPPLPELVVLGTEPYYVRDGYHYYYKNDTWFYSRSTRGPWKDLPKGHYPKEVKFSDRGPERDGGLNPDHKGQ